MNKLINKDKEELVKYDGIKKFCDDRLLRNITYNDKFNKLSSNLSEACMQWKEFMHDPGIFIYIKLISNEYK